jgi:hypothetical protein
MLTKTRKKTVFLGLLKSIFKEESDILNEENCIRFYHFLLDCLENEAHRLTQTDREYYVFLSQIIEIITCFDRFLQVKPDLEAVFFCENKMKRLLFVFLQYDEKSLDTHNKRLETSYNSIKYEFFE